MIALLRRVGEEKVSPGASSSRIRLKKSRQRGSSAVGSGVRADDGSIRKLDVKAGDRVLFGKFGGTDVKVDGEDLLILRETDILGVVEGKENQKILLNPLGLGGVFLIIVARRKDDGSEGSKVWSRCACSDVGGCRRAGGCGESDSGSEGSERCFGQSFGAPASRKTVLRSLKR